MSPDFLYPNWISVILKKLIFEICITRGQVAYCESGYREKCSLIARIWIKSKICLLHQEKNAMLYLRNNNIIINDVLMQTNGQMCISKGYREPKNVETTVGLHGRWGWSQKGKINVVYGLDDGIVSVRQGMYFKTRLDRHPWIHDSQTTSWMDLCKLSVIRREFPFGNMVKTRFAKKLPPVNG